MGLEKPKTYWKISGLIRSVHIGFALLSVVLTLLAPMGWHGVFVYTVVGLFLLQNGIYGLLEGRKDRIGFVYFFAMAFFFTNFAYPLFYYRLQPGHAIFDLPWNTAVISRATAIAYMGYAFFMLGVSRGKKEALPRENERKWSVRPFSFAILLGMMIMCFVAFVAFGGWQAMHSVYSAGGSLTTVGVYSYFYVLFSLTAFLTCMSIYRVPRPWGWIGTALVGLMMLAVLATGSRSLVLGCALILLVGWDQQVRRFRSWELLLLTIVGAVVLSAVAWSRHGNGGANVMDDLVMNNRNLYVLVDYGMHHAYTYCHGMLVDLATPIPGMTKWIVRWMHEPYELLSAQELPTYLIAGTGAKWGLGTNMIGDAFRSFGYVGTAISMLLIGWAVRASYDASSRSIYAYVIYYLLVSYAVFYTRAPILFPPRVLVWTLLLVALLRLRKEEVCE